jgi:hypothetical protein
MYLGNGNMILKNCSKRCRYGYLIYYEIRYFFTWSTVPGARREHWADRATGCTPASPADRPHSRRSRSDRPAHGAAARRRSSGCRPTKATTGPSQAAATATAGLRLSQRADLGSRRTSGGGEGRTGRSDCQAAIPAIKISIDCNINFYV